MEARTRARGMEVMEANDAAASERSRHGESAQPSASATSSPTVASARRSGRLRAVSARWAVRARRTGSGMERPPRAAREKAWRDDASEGGEEFGARAWIMSRSSEVL